jgi:hypothetical protein
VYLELVITHRWSRSGWIEGLVYQARVNFLELMQTPKGEPDFERSRRFPLIALRSGPPHVPVTVALDREILCGNIIIREKVKACKEIIRNPQEEEFSDWTFDVEKWTVSISNNPLSTCRPVNCQKLCDGVRDVYRSLQAPPQAASVGLQLLESRMRSSYLLWDILWNALDMTHAVEYARFALLVERFREVEVGSRLMAAVPSTQTRSHTPPSSTYDSNEHTRLSDMFTPNPEAEHLMDEEFYFAFGQEHHLVVIGQKAQEAVLAGVLRPEVDTYNERLTELAQTLIIVELIETALTTKVHPT